MDEPELKKIKLKDVRPGPIRHESLPRRSFSSKFVPIYEILGPYLWLGARAI